MKKTVAIFSALMLAGFSQTAAFAIDNFGTSVLIEEVPHELPAPTVSVNSDGVSLVAWLGQDPTETDADPDTVGDQVCSSNAIAYCDIVYALVDQDGNKLTDVAAISPTNVAWYYSAPSIYWNESLEEWLVLMTNWEENGLQDTGVWGQRVDVDGELIGDAVELPATSVTPYDDRSELAMIDLSASFDNPVLAQARWSDESSAYFVTWYATSSELSGFDFDEDVTSNDAIFGVFLNADLSVTDGLDASFVISWDRNVRCCNVSLGYAAEINEWAVAWVDEEDQDYLLARVSNPTAPVVSRSITVLDRELYSTNDRPIAGGLAWYESEEAWFSTFSWENEDPGADPLLPALNDAEMAVFGRWVSLEGTVSDLQIVDDGFETFLDAQNADEPVERPASFIYRQTLDIDPKTGYLHIVYGKDFQGTPDSIDEDTSADGYRHFAFYTIYDPIAGEVIESTLYSAEFPAQSSRPQIDIGCSSGAVVYQDWSNGDWEGPAGVQFDGIEGVGSCEPSLAHTGIDATGIAVGGAAVIAVGLAIVARRRARA